MSETYEETQQEKRQMMRMGAWSWWDKGDVGNSKNKRNAVIAMARYYGHPYALIAKGVGLSRNRVREIAERAVHYGRMPIVHAELAGSFLAEGNYDCVKTYLSTDDLCKLISYCEALK